jgi:hypothetical protein
MPLNSPYPEPTYQVNLNAFKHGKGHTYYTARLGMAQHVLRAV